MTKILRSSQLFKVCLALCTVLLFTIACTEVSELDIPLNSSIITEIPKTNTPQPTEPTDPEPTVVQVPTPVAPITPEPTTPEPTTPEPTEPYTPTPEPTTPTPEPTTPTPEPTTPTPEPTTPTTPTPEPSTPSEPTTPTEPTAPTEPPAPIPQPPSDGSKKQETLINSYYNLHVHDDLTKSPDPVVWGIKYQPYDPFGGWDALTWSSWYYKDATLSNWLNLELNRDAMIAVVWKGDTLPSWLDASWTEGRVVNESRTFTKKFSKGKITLGGAENKGSYTLLLAEADGSAPIPPTVPIGKEKPVPNTQCPTWVHDSYSTTGPDGRQYATWHPQIDPTYWCYFGHEHGSDPSQMGYEPYFDYVAYHNNRQDERHEGFKGFLVEDGSLTWYINIHATVGMIMRVCVPLHTVVVAATNANGDLVAEIAFKGDFGETRANSGDNALLKTAACDQVALEAQDTKAEKRVRVLNDPNYEDRGYEQWRMIGSEFLGLEFNSEKITMDIRNPMTGCNGLTCATGVLASMRADKPDEIRQHGERRSIDFHNGIKLKYNAVHDLNDGVADGFFYTNAYGNGLAKEGEEGSIRQFIQPGLNVAGPSGFHGTKDAWHAVYEKDMHQIPSMELEDSLGRMN